MEQKTEHESDSHSVVSDSLRPHGLQPARLLCPQNSPGNNTGVGCHSFLQGIFQIQGLNLGLLHCRQTLYCHAKLFARKEKAFSGYTYQIPPQQQLLSVSYINFSHLCTHIQLNMVIMFLLINRECMCTHTSLFLSLPVFLHSWGAHSPRFFLVFFLLFLSSSFFKLPNIMPKCICLVSY